MAFLGQHFSFWVSRPSVGGDFIAGLSLFIIVIVAGIFTAGIGALVASLFCAFFYNPKYAEKLLGKGYEFVGTADEISKAKQALFIKN
jgi:hypothetical protein